MGLVAQKYENKAYVEINRNYLQTEWLHSLSLESNDIISQWLRHFLYVHFSLYCPVLLYRSPEEHYFNVKHICVNLFLAWVRLCDKGLTDVWCVGAWLYTLRWIHPLSVYPQVYVMWVLRNLGNVEKLFLPPAGHSCVFIMHRLIVIFWVYFLFSRSLDWVCELLHQPKCQLIVWDVWCPMYKSFSSFLLVFVFVCKLFEKKMSNQEWDANQGSYLFNCSGYQQCFVKE